MNFYYNKIINKIHGIASKFNKCIPIARPSMYDISIIYLIESLLNDIVSHLRMSHTTIDVKNVDRE